VSHSRLKEIVASQKKRENELFEKKVLSKKLIKANCRFGNPLIYEE